MAQGNGNGSGNGKLAYLRLLNQDALTRISRLELLARGVMEGFISGRHESPYKGASVEFAEHRQYVPGDNIRDMDWRVYGKTDRYYVKQYKEETNLRATILLDGSGSMTYSGERASPVNGEIPSKLEYARYLAATLTYLLVNQQDAVGLVTHDTEIRDFIPARSNARHMRVLLHHIEALQSKGDTSLATVYHDIAERVPRRGMVIIISDLFDEVEPLMEALHHFRYRKHEVVVLHVMADEELTFPFDSWSDFRDLEESGIQEELDPLTIRAEYLSRVSAFVNRVEMGCGELEIDYVPMNTKIPFEIAISGFLAARRGQQK
jgi:uncharacterized protein (DUF58 family)